MIRMSRSQALIALLATAGYVPLMFWSTNQTELARPWAPVAIYFALGAAAWLVAIVVPRRWMETTTYAGMMSLILVAAGGSLWSEFGVLMVLAMATIVGMIIARLSGSKALHLGMSIVVVFFIINPLGNIIVERINWGTSSVVDQDARLVGGLETRSDFYLVVLDAYGGSLGLEAEFDFRNETFTDLLQEAGFSLPIAWASYPLTHLSIPSFLEMGYIADDGFVTSPASTAALHRVIGGDNNLVSLAKSSGYAFTMIEAGWGGSKCGGQVDTCVHAPIYDDGLAAIAASSVLGDKLRFELGHGFTQGALGAMDWLRSNTARLSSNEHPDLVFAHLLVPHPPTFLDRSCHVRASPVYASPLLRNAGDSAELVKERREGYLEQLECVNKFLAEFVDLVGSEATIVMLGDHGPESLNQTFTDPRIWSSRQITERLNAFLAVRTPGSCDMMSPLVLPNVLPQILGCSAGLVVPLLPDRLFTVVELDAPAQVYEIATERVTTIMHQSLPSPVFKNRIGS